MLAAIVHACETLDVPILLTVLTGLDELLQGTDFHQPLSITLLVLYGYVVTLILGDQQLSITLLAYVLPPLVWRALICSGRLPHTFFQKIEKYTL